MNREMMEREAMVRAAKYFNPVSMEPAYDGGYFDGFRAGADWLASRPPAERLRAEELAMLRECPRAEEAEWLRKVFGCEIFEKRVNP